MAESCSQGISLHLFCCGGRFNMKHEWLLIGALFFYCVVFFVCIVTGFRDLRESRKHTFQKHSKRFDLDKFCADFSRDDPVKDPYVLIKNRWVDQSYPPN
jgi:hypothetical protein